jgi:hypothetical protein
MTEYEFKQMLGKYAESIFMEIWGPIESKISLQIQDVDKLLSDFREKLQSIDQRQRQLRRDFTKLDDKINIQLDHMSDAIEKQKELNISLSEEILEEVNEDIKLAIEYGRKIDELYEKTLKISNVSLKDFDSVILEAKSVIKHECDLRIIDILNLDKNFRELVRLADKSLRDHQLYKNIEEPTKIIF